MREMIEQSYIQLDDALKSRLRNNMPMLALKCMREDGCILIGGAPRDLLLWSPPVDWDFCMKSPNIDPREVRDRVLSWLLAHKRVVEATDTVNASSVRVRVDTDDWRAYQFIHDWAGSPEQVLDALDFTMAKCALYFDEDGEFCATAHPDWEADTNAKRLVYTSPNRAERFAGGSLLRAMKFAKRGWTINDENLAKVAAHAAGVADWRAVAKRLRQSYEGE